VVVLVQFFADLALLVARLLQKPVQERALRARERQHAVATEQEAELAEPGNLAQVLEGVMLILPRGLVSMIKPEPHVVAYDAPGTVRPDVQVVPALLDGRAAVEPLAVDVDGGALQLDHGAKLLLSLIAELANGRIGSAAGNRKLRPQLPVVAVLGEKRISQHLAEDLGEELPLKFRL